MPYADADPRDCPRCKRPTYPRAGQAPRYCATCGLRFTDTAPEVSYRRRFHPESPPAATAAGILGACSIAPLVGLPCGILAIWLGLGALDEIKRSGNTLGGRRPATFGVILGTATSAFWLIVCAGCLPR